MKLRLRAFVTALRFVIFGATVFAASSALAQNSQTSEQQECFDAEVYATIAQETPSEMPNVADGSIVMGWPWFLDLKIKRVLHGDIDRDTLTVLAVQHTYINPQYWLWWLRRNSAGSFNVIGRDTDDHFNRCPAGTAPEEPYISLGKGQTLDDLRRAGERRYGRFP